MAKLAEKVYGDALFELARETDSVDSLYEETLCVQKALKENEELLSILRHPKIVNEEKVSVIKEIFSGRVSDELTGLLSLLVEKNHVDKIEAVLSYFIGEVKEYKHIGVAKVCSAFPLTPQQEKQVEERLLSVTDYKSFEMEFKVDPSLIAGMTIRIRDRVVDSSVRTRLKELKKELSNIQVSGLA